MFGEIDWINDATPRSGALNMALDEALISCVRRVTLRTYLWERPTVSIGYFGSLEETGRRFPGYALVRRATGGGMVLHEGDFTYSLAIPRGNGVIPGAPAEIYRDVHGRLAGALRGFGVDAILAADERSTSRCFSGWSRDDLLSGGRKIGGAAQRRTRAGLLLQGSLQGVTLPGTFARAFAFALGRRVRARGWDGEELVLGRRLEIQRYGSEAWLRRRA